MKKIVIFLPKCTMKRFESIICAAFVAVATFSGCAKVTTPEPSPNPPHEEPNPPQEEPIVKYPVTFIASKADAATLVGAGEASSVANWSVGDAISVFDGSGVNCKFTLTEGADTPTAKFEGEVTKIADSYMVLYPYRAGITVDAQFSAINGVCFKADQTAVLGSFDMATGIMAAQSDEENNIAFRNLAGFAKIVCGFPCKEVSINCNDASAEIAGNVDILLDGEGGEPTAMVYEGACNKISLSGNILPGAPYYIALLPCTIDKGFSLDFTAVDGKRYHRMVGEAVTIEGGSVTDLGTFRIEDVEAFTPYLTFSAGAAQTFTFVKGSDAPESVNTIEYSVNGGDWVKMPFGEAVDFGGDKGDLRLRGKSSEGTSLECSNYDGYMLSNIQFGNNDVKVRCSGDIRTIVDYENYWSADTGNARFVCLFSRASALVSAPDLPSTKLATRCYLSMFYRTSIERAPRLPATELPWNCYASMFSHCEHLIYSPDLTATTVGSTSYVSMFWKCISLKKAPEILATEFLGEANCNSMFFECTSLEEGPSVLFAETLTEHCYDKMFRDCESLKTAPVINAIYAAEGTSQCWGMFQNCKSLKEAQESLFSEGTQMQKDMCHDMFRGCTSLKKAPALPSKSLAEGCYAAMFQDCSNLQAAPKLPAETLVTDCYTDMFNGCFSLKEVWLYAKNDIPNGMSDNTFTGCPSKGVTVYVNADSAEIIKETIKQPDWTYENM